MPLLRRHGRRRTLRGVCKSWPQGGASRGRQAEIALTDMGGGCLDSDIGTSHHSLDPQRSTDEVMVSPNAFVRIVGSWSVGWP